MTITLKEARQQYPQEWIAFRVEKEGKDVDETHGQVLEHDKDRREIHRRLRQRKVKNAYITFTGPPIRLGYEAMFQCAKS